MLLGMKAKVGSGSDHNAAGFLFYEGIISSEPFFTADGDCKILILTKGQLVVADTYFMYDVTELISF